MKPFSTYGGHIETDEAELGVETKGKVGAQADRCLEC